MDLNELYKLQQNIKINDLEKDNENSMNFFDINNSKNFIFIKMNDCSFINFPSLLNKIISKLLMYENIIIDNIISSMIFCTVFDKNMKSIDIENIRNLLVDQLIQEFSIEIKILYGVDKAFEGQFGVSGFYQYCTILKNMDKIVNCLSKMEYGNKHELKNY